MQKEAFPWKRLWCPRGEQINLFDDGFLVDPASELAQYFPTKVVPFEVVGRSPCVVLLGEPGIGKSTALQREFEHMLPTVRATGGDCLCFDLRDFGSHDRLVADLFGTESIKRWVLSDYELHLFLDSLDEGLLLVENISRVLQNSLKKLPTERLFLRIASRPRDWSPTLEMGLREIWPAGGVSVFEAAPLLKKDAAVAYTITVGEMAAADAAVGDAHQFLEAVIQKGVVALASSR